MCGYRAKMLDSTSDFSLLKNSVKHNAGKNESNLLMTGPENRSGHFTLPACVHSRICPGFGFFFQRVDRRPAAFPGLPPPPPVDRRGGGEGDRRGRHSGRNSSMALPEVKKSTRDLLSDAGQMARLTPPRTLEAGWTWKGQFGLFRAKTP